MIIEIRGVNFLNRGAELMLVAILENYKYKNIKFCIEPSSHSPFIKRTKLGLYQKIGYGKYTYILNFFGNFIPKKLRKNFGLILEKEVDIILDASGFAYTDQWGTKILKLMSKDVLKWKKQGKKIIFLPQAFGPFENEKNKRNMSIILDNIDFIFPRDKISYEYLNSIKNNKKIIQYPDFTNLISLKKEKKDIDKICIIPNVRMLDKTDYDYYKFLLDTIIYLLEKKKNIFFLIHEGKEDFDIAKKLVNELDLKIDIIWPNDALLVKKEIINSSMVISSRFHGVVSALSSGIPTLSTGWSHKYRELFNDYNVSECFIDLNDNDNILNKLEWFINDKEQIKIREKLEKYQKIEKEKTKDMWKNLDKFIEIK